MPRQDAPSALLTKLETCKGHFGAAAANKTALLLRSAEGTRFSTPDQLIRLHEAALYLRAYPQDPVVVHLADRVLASFARRLKGLDLTAFEDPEVSGIAGTALSTSYSYSFAKPLSERHGDSLAIDWDAYEHPHRLAFHLGQRISDAFEDWAIAPHANWQSRYEQAGGSVPWLLDGITPEVYDLLDLPLRWNVADSPAARSHARIPTRRIYYHDQPFLTRRDVSIASEFRKPPITVERVPRAKAWKMFEVILDASAVRYRQLYGFEYPDMGRVYAAHLGRGMDLYFFGLARKWRLPSREYCAGMFFKNGVPTGYVEVMWANGRMEVGFNLYYTFRQGETAWLYVQLLKLFREQYKIREFFVDPYQLGHENDEAIESGAFWFYYKLGFRPKSKAIEQLAQRELARISGQPGYRTPARILAKLAAEGLSYRV